MLARVQGHCGCANITRVGRSWDASIRVATGHWLGVRATLPGALSYLNRHQDPAAAAISQNPAAAINTGANLIAAWWKQSVCHHSGFSATLPCAAVLTALAYSILRPR
jgi:hypothetical protein